MNDYAAPLIALHKAVNNVEVWAALQSYDRALSEVYVALQQLMAVQVAIERLRDAQRERVG